MKRNGSDVSKSGREDNTTRAAHPQFGFTMPAVEVRPDFRERHTLSMRKETVVKELMLKNLVFFTCFWASS